MPILYWCIRNTKTKDYWSNETGWTEFPELCTLFTNSMKEKIPHIPLDGKWEEFSPPANL